MLIPTLNAGFDSEVKVRCPNVPTFSIEVASGSIPQKTRSRRDLLDSTAATTAERSIHWKEIRHYTGM
jgi:hypothetical protein